MTSSISPRICNRRALIVIQTKGIDEDVDGIAVFAAQGRFEVAQVALFLHDVGMLLRCSGEK